MSKVGFVGCGKLGLMVALTIESRGHSVKGYDVNPAVAQYLKDRKIPFQEEHADELLANTQMEMVPLSALCDWADILFIAVQTPHAPQFEGSTPLPKERADFDYTYLKEAVKAVCFHLRRPIPCVIISTVLPGTIEREIKPVIEAEDPHKRFRLVYSPQFIAMGTVHEDFLNPEFWLIGGDDARATDEVCNFFFRLTTSFIPTIRTDIRTAEGIKVLYNTLITAKTVLANLYGEMSERLNMRVDDIFKAITFSTRRLLSPKYLKAGMGDGGGCHPRDNIALSYIADNCGMSFNFFDALMQARESHCEFLAQRCLKESIETGLPIHILGKAFKPETNIETGSPSILLYNILKEWGANVTISDEPNGQAVYFIGCQHQRYASYSFPKNSVVIDPFRYIYPHDGVKVISLGAGKPKTHEVSQQLTYAAH